VQSANEQKLPDMETLCQECEGEGGHTEGGDWVRCYNCRGAGFLPTDFGRRVLALVGHHFDRLHNGMAQGSD
jgi:hypothetical protein